MSRLILQGKWIVSSKIVNRGKLNIWDMYKSVNKRLSTQVLSRKPEGLMIKHQTTNCVRNENNFTWLNALIEEYSFYISPFLALEQNKLEKDKLNTIVCTASISSTKMFSFNYTSNHPVDIIIHNVSLKKKTWNLAVLWNALFRYFSHLWSIKWITREILNSVLF